ncbi:MAG: TAXI family TRAP transporter solute-binding subunit [Gammaproteobacteria bacterium]
MRALFTRLVCMTVASVTLSIGVPAANAADTYISIGSCPIGCTAYTWSAGIADVINRSVPGVQVTAEETKGYVANIRLLQAGDLEASFATSLSSFQAYEASGNYEGTTPGKILSWMAIKPTAMHVIALEGNGIESLADLEGKRVGMGQPGGVSMLDADALMSQLELEPDQHFKPFRVRLGAMANMLGDGQIDAALWNGSFPLPPVIKLASQHPVKLIEIPDDTFTGLKAGAPPYFRNSIPPNTYKGIDAAIASYGLSNGLVVHADVPEDLVYRMTRAVVENLAALKGVHPAFGNVSKETILEGFGAPLHPGALRYYREIGVPGIEEFVARTSK